MQISSPMDDKGPRGVFSFGDCRSLGNWVVSGFGAFFVEGLKGD